MGTQMIITANDEGDFGPAMLALVPRQRGFVIAMLDRPDADHTACARAAGYDGQPQDVRRTAYRLAHDPKIQAAIQEEARKRIGGAAILGASVLIEIANNPKSKDADRIKAAFGLLNRAGLHEKTEVHSVVEHRGDDQAAIGRIRAMAELLGLDPKVLLGRAGVVEAEFTDVTPDPNDLSDIL